MARLPVMTKLPYMEPQKLVLKLPGEEKFLLQSALVNEDTGRYSILGSDPFLVLSCKGKQVTLKENGRKKVLHTDPMRILKELLEQFRRSKKEGVPFTGGAVGYFAYDLGWLFEKLPCQAEDDLQLPDLYLPFYDRVIVIDHLEKETLIFSHGFPLTGMDGIARAKKRLDELVALITREEAVWPPNVTKGSVAGELVSNFSREQYLKVVERSKEYIAAGDIFQVNLSQRFAVPVYITPWELYCRLTKLNPAPFASYLEFAPVSVVSASPERFLRVKGDWVETRPIKGTRPRGSSKQEDVRLRRELWESTKDRAELVMIVDLQRNDLGKVCQVGSVRVPEIFRLEEYATVFHLVSTVEGTLRPGLGICDVIEAAFPGGSITGAPKIRAMEIIEELEPTKRSIYTGSIGYIDFSGDADLNIVIRTFLVKNGIAYFQVGGGIVADSEPEAEYQETLDKAKALINSLGKERGGLGCFTGI